jgi:hypothetical protein
MYQIVGLSPFAIKGPQTGWFKQYKLISRVLGAGHLWSGYLHCQVLFWGGESLLGSLYMSEKDWRNTLEFLFLKLFIHLFICANIVRVIATPPLPASLLAPRQNLFCPFLQFCWREDINNNKKDKAFLLVWDKYSYTERFLGLLPCTCVLQPELDHFYQTSSLLPRHLPIVASASLRLLYSLLYSGHIKYFQVLD